MWLAPSTCTILGCIVVISSGMHSWEDTVNVPDCGHVRIAWLLDDRPGGWMYHCQILEHHATGMVAHFEVLPRLDDLSPEPTPPDGGNS
jgi:Multicopper oxidase